MHESYHGFIPNPCANTSKSIFEDLMIVYDTRVSINAPREFQTAALGKQVLSVFPSNCTQLP